MVVAKAVFIKVGLQIMASHIVIDTAQPVLYERPESLNCIGVDVANNVHLLAVIDSAVLPAASAESLIGRVIVGEHNRP